MEVLILILILIVAVGAAAIKVVDVVAPKFWQALGEKIL